MPIKSDIDWYNRLRQRFEVVERLGRGSESSVFRVRDLWNANAELALKVLDSSDRISGEALQRFYKELRILRSLDHPNLVKAYHFIVLDGIAAFTMEFVSGDNLTSLLERGDISVEQIDPIFEQILCALALLHANNMVHRDLKLENILLRRDGVVKLSDLGIADQCSYSTPSGKRTIYGTPSYLPPEYIKLAEYDVRGDVYAVGVMLFEVITGQRRLIDGTPEQTWEILQASNFELPYAMLESAPERYVKIIRRATALDPRLRYRSATEMRDEFIKSWAFD